MKILSLLDKGVAMTQGKNEDTYLQFIANRLNLTRTILTKDINTMSLCELKKLNKNIYAPIVNSDEALFDNLNEKHQYKTLLADIVQSLMMNAIKKQYDILEEKLFFILDCLDNVDGDLETLIRNYYYVAIGTRSKYYIKNFTNSDFLNNIIFNENLSDVNYLYKTGEYVSDNEIKIVQYFNTLSQDRIDELANIVVDGFIRGYKSQNLDYTIKDFVTLWYPLGFEKMALAAYKLLSKDFKVVFRICSSTNPNKQYDFFHRNDEVLFMDERYVNEYLAYFEDALKKNYDCLKNYGGALWIETFGEKQVMPSENVLVKTNKEYTALQNKLNNQFSQLYSQYTNSDERSFTIISYPCPDIGDEFEAIFDETIKINTLDCDKYAKIQQTIIDALDQGDYVRIVGKGDNKTDLCVKLHTLNNPDKETNFENCTADVNIPVGEVFTSPVLKGTTGKLYVKEVFLRGLKFTDLEFDIVDGLTTTYNCSVFDKKEDNLDFIKQNILDHYEQLPMGEFAIGTNTLAYMIARKYHIEDKLDILIAEKTGPHFAFGDTCFSHQEEIATFNPNGKEVIAKENEISALRHTDKLKAYYGCHTDITIPFDELDYISVVTKNNEKIDIIRDGIFVLSGTEELNEPLINM